MAPAGGLLAGKLGEIMRQKARGRRLVRRATQVQARSQQLAAGDGRGVDVLLVTHGRSLAGPSGPGQPDRPGPGLLM